MERRQHRKVSRVCGLQCIDVWPASRLIRSFGQKTVIVTDKTQPSLVHLTLMGGQFRCAKLLFEYAADQQQLVSLRWRDGDILGWALANNSKGLVEFVLQEMSEQCSPPEETAQCLRDHFARLVKQFPQVMQKYIMNDKFCFEYGRFDVPQNLFAKRPEVPIAVLGRAPTAWRPIDETNEIKDFWKQRGMTDFIDLDGSSDTKISAVSKFLCIDLSTVQDQQMVVKSLLSANYPVEVFETQSIKNLVRWRWLLQVYIRILLRLVVDLSSAFLFFAAASMFGIQEDGTDAVALQFSHSLFFLAYLYYEGGGTALLGMRIYRSSFPSLCISC